MLLEAAQECQQDPGNVWSGGSCSGFFQPSGNRRCIDQNGSTLEETEYAQAKLYYKNMATVELFVFLFAPLVNRIKVSLNHIPPNQWAQMESKQYVENAIWF